MSRTKNITIRKEKQGWKYLDPKPANHILIQPELYFKCLSRAKRRILNFLIMLNNQHEDVFPSQTTLAEVADVCRQHANDILKQLEGDGLILRNYRHKKSCQYKISSWFYNLDLRTQLTPYLDALKCLPYFIPFTVSMLLSVCTTQQDYNYNYLNIKTQRYSTTRDYGSIKSTQKRYHMGEIRGTHPLNYFDPTLSPVFSALKNIKLTEAGKIWLSIFPDMCIKLADEQLGRCLDVKNPCAYLFKVALEECKKRNIQPDWEKRKMLSSYYKTSDNLPLFTPQEKKVSSVTYQGATKSSHRNNTDQSPTHTHPMYKEWKPEYETVDINRELEARKSDKWKQSVEFMKSLGIDLESFPVPDKYVKSEWR